MRNQPPTRRTFRRLCSLSAAFGVAVALATIPARGDEAAAKRDRDQLLEQNRELQARVEAIAAAAGDAKDSDKVVLFNGKDTTGWKFRNEKEKESWKVVSDVKLDAADNKKLVGEGEGGKPDAALLRPPVAHGSDLITEKTFGDCELHIEFMVPKGSNSGVYLMGQYEVQVLDSHGKQKLGPGDCGGIYNTKAPSENASKAPGEWQSFDITFRAPRFGPDGKKTENAKFVKVVHNGKTIHENVEAPKATGSELPGGEKPTGPLFLQGDHGVVAYRNIWVKPAGGAAK